MQDAELAQHFPHSAMSNRETILGRAWLDMMHRARRELAPTKHVGKRSLGTPGVKLRDVTNR